MSEVLGIRLAGEGSPKVVLYASLEVALNSGNAYMLFLKAEDIAMDLRRVSADSMLEVYNVIVPSVRRWKSTDDFGTRIEGAIAIWEAAIRRLPLKEKTDG
jgi:hypothetical protein